MAVVPRDVIAIWDRYTRPNKRKWHICVCERRQLFLRINSAPVFKPFHPLLAKHNRFLRHDSYVELQQLVRHIADDIVDAEHLGRLSPQEARKLVAAVWQAETLSEDHKEFIATRLLEE